jgi:hypothetical protein
MSESGGLDFQFKPNIDAHGLKIQVTGLLRFLPKFLGGGSRLFGQYCLGGSPILGAIAFFLTSLSENMPGGPTLSPLPLPPPHPLSAFMRIIIKKTLN